MSSPFNEEKYKQLLEGLEVSVVKYSEIEKENRYDSEFFKQRFLKNDDLLLSKKHFLISDGFTVTDGEHGSVEYLESGVKYLTAENVKNGFVDISNVRYVSQEVDFRNRRSSVETGDILISIKGTLGQIAVAESWLKPCNMNRDVAILKAKADNKKNYYLAIFLMSKFGEIQSSRGGSGGVQQMITLERLRNFVVPEMTDSFYQQIETLVKSAHAKLAESKSLYAQAEDTLLGEFGLKGWRPNNNPVNIKQLKDSYLASGRLDAEYYQAKYEDYATFIWKYIGGADTLGNICTLNEKNFNPLDSCEYKYIELSNIGNSGEITGCTTSIGAELPSRARRLVRTNDVIVSSIEGSLQSVALVTDEYDNAICSTGFYVVKSETINPETLLVLFKSEPMQNLLKQGCSGTILTAIGRNELQNIVMPKIRNEVQTEIATYVQKSISLRNEAKQLLESAKLKVEDIISTPPLI